MRPSSKVIFCQAVMSAKSGPFQTNYLIHGTRILVRHGKGSGTKGLQLTG